MKIFCAAQPSCSHVPPRWAPSSVRTEALLFGSLPLYLFCWLLIHILYILCNKLMVWWVNRLSWVLRATLAHSRNPRKGVRDLQTTVGWAEAQVAAGAWSARAWREEPVSQDWTLSLWHRVLSPGTQCQNWVKCLDTYWWPRIVC